MNRRKALAVLVFLILGSLPWFVLKLLPATPNAPTSAPPSPPPVEIPPARDSALPPAAPAPTAPVHTPITTSVPPEFAAVRQRYLDSVPPFPRERLSVHIAPSGGTVYLMELEIDGFPVESTDVRVVQNRRGEWYYLDQPWPTLSAELPAFPRHRENAAEQKIHEQLRNEQNVEEAVEPLGSTWRPSDAGLRPCLKWRVDYRTAQGDQKKEVWCIHAQTLNVDGRGERVRN